MKRPIPRGVSLIEAIVAMAVMAFGMVAIVGLQGTLRQNSDIAKQRSEVERQGRAVAGVNVGPNAGPNNRGPRPGTAAGANVAADVQTPALTLPELPVGNPLALLILGLSLAGLGWVGARRYARQH